MPPLRVQISPPAAAEQTGEGLGAPPTEKKERICENSGGGVTRPREARAETSRSSAQVPTAGSDGSR